MENSPPRIEKFPWTSNSSFSAKEGRSGYEPSDTETERQDPPRHKRERKNLTLGHEEAKVLNLRSKSPMSLHRKHPSSKFELEISSSASSVTSSAGRRHQSRSPYRPFRAADGDAPYPKNGLDNVQTSVSPVTKPEFARRHTSPYQPERENLNWRSEKANQRRAMTAPRQRGGREREASSHGTNPSIGEINELVAQAKFKRDSITGDSGELIITSTESSFAGDIFFSREYNAMTKQKTLLTKPQKLEVETQFNSPRFNKVLSQRGTPFHHQHQNRANGHVNNVNVRGSSSSSTTMLSRPSTASSNGAKSKKSCASGSVKSDVSSTTSVSIQKLMANRKKNQAETWFACMRRVGRSSNKSPEHRSVDEASIIYKSFVLQSLPQFWADKYQPTSLDGFICHQQEAQLLKELVSQDACPHILLKGPSGSGKRALAMALLQEIFGDAISNERRPVKITVPITSSSHHMELNVNLEPNAKFALMGLVKEISTESAITPEVSNLNFKSDYKVLVLYEVDKADNNIQYMIKWIIDRYSDICKIIVCCEDDVDILEPVKNRFKIINIDAPPTHEIMDVLIQIAKQEEIDLSMNFAAKIANKSKQNLRKAIMALEACRAHNYPFSEEQPIPLGWEEIIMEISVEILSDPSHSRLFSIRGKLQKLLGDFVHPNLILRKLVEQLLKGIDSNLKRELFYWHAYYDKRLPPGATALLKLEEFVAKFMSIYRKSTSGRQFV
ncbi:hypothetical protein QN277_003903 [Acacia crassicarpa]|uniref:Replication factor C subunit n=1 Tax=Acacia crassicarpa TaxID=499986 RepID=A0AAE1JWW4_9FABA|nr:hypothetical protein QN277_003903 [Acacia crassicarpa]